MKSSLLPQACLCALLLVTQAACTTPPIHRSLLSHITNDLESTALQQATRIRAMSASELANEAETLQRAYASHRSEDSRLRLALFLAVAPSPAGDRLRALSLLDVPPSDANGRGRNHPLAQLLLPSLQDYRRADEAQNTAQQKLRELQQSNDQMRQKLDAIRDIEVNLQERPKTK